MQTPLQIVFRNVHRSEAVAEKVRQRVQWLERHGEELISCRVAVEAPHRHHHRGNLYRVRIDLRVRGAEIVVGRPHDLHLAHRDVQVAIRDAFDEARRRLEHYSRRRRDLIRVRAPEIPLPEAI